MDNASNVFHSTIREGTIVLLLFSLLYSFSYFLVEYFKKRDNTVVKSFAVSNNQKTNTCYNDQSTEIIVNRISTYLCTFSIAVSLGAAFLLPISIVSNEILILYPNHVYFQWLNESLIQGLWNCVFLLSNSALFVLLPFAYLFMESEGFLGYRNDLAARLYETAVVLILLVLVILGICCILTALVNDNLDISYLFKVFEFWNYHLPFLYSCVSFLGVLMLLVCTPLGFVYLFDVVRQFTQPQLFDNLNEEFNRYSLEKRYLERCIQKIIQGHVLKKASNVNKYVKEVCKNGENDELQLEKLKFEKQLEQLELKRLSFKRLTTSSLLRTLLYAVIIIALLVLTSLAIFLVIINTLELLIGIKALPCSTRKFTLGIESLSKLGVIGAVAEVIIILYLITTSFFGLYSLPMFSRIKPKAHRTSFPHLILNSVLLLTLSSALPLLVRILGITNFDLLGDYGRIEWLGNFLIVLMYNVIFAITATLCLINKFTARVRSELYNRLKDCYRCIKDYLFSCS